MFGISGDLKNKRRQGNTDAEKGEPAGPPGERTSGGVFLGQAHFGFSDNGFQLAEHAIVGKFLLRSGACMRFLQGG
ncbi:hypothetical protein ESA_03533 [Cronobacter sakazakii ATCC BAA-894]|uniref:Uncharacterized protein n=1 Tax=Cronobacter sakazakii (strain ATCC BAA-894) TaxID=290339 RepID=A7MQE6_CROS8|nr:hypothetical protein ESA_03533 [Cronobacter sakazakii ATCC BAA-894]